MDWVQEAKGTHQGIVINAGAYTHTSIALADAIASVELPVAAVHISKVSVGMNCGFGPFGYLMGMEALVNHLSE